MRDLSTLLHDGLNALHLTMSEQGQRSLLVYIELLAQWNRVHNLTAIESPEDIMTKHILDSLAVAPYVGEHIIDVGTGGGLPGIPLALLYPERAVTLLESRAKKVHFLIQAKHVLPLPNVTVVKSRVEEFHPTPLYDTVVSRAFASLREMLELTAHLCGPGGRFVAMKGVYPETELSELPEEFTVTAIHPLSVPGLSAQRHVVIIGHRE